MKKITIILTIVIVFLAIWFFLSGGEESTRKQGRMETRESGGGASLREQERFEENRRSQIEQREKGIKQGLEAANVPINFWGKVVDQNGKPLERVDITYRIQQPRAMWDSNSIVKHILTDSNGDFFITGDKGSSFGIKTFEKEGYQKTKGQVVSFTYSDNSERYVPDINNPKVYTLIEKNKIQNLIKSSKQLRLNWDGIPVQYNLETGRFEGSGEIQITALRGEIKGQGREARYDWSFKVEALNGGIIETTREAAYLAPQKGYKPIWEYAILSSDPKWVYRKKGDTFLFFKLANGNYGRLEIDFSAEFGRRVSGRVNSYLNPSGGSILE